jgi:ABC-type nitrate/sulfonate/bicarbonate transport system substrate-binding protein
LRAIDKGAPITLLRIEQGPAPYQVYAKPNIREFSDLKGKQVILGGEKDITRVYFERMSTPKGLAPGSYDMVFAGSSGARLAALISGSVDATILAPPFSFKAKAEKFSYLPGAPDYAKGIPFVAFVVNTNWARANHSSIAKFLKAYAKGVDWFNDPANRKEAIDILAKKLSVDSDQAEKTYDVYVSLKAFDGSGAVNQESLGPLIEILKAQGDIKGPTDLSRFFKQDIIDAAR